MNRLSLQTALEKFVPNVYFQPPANLGLKYPCIIYNKTDKDRKYGNNSIYASKQAYQLMLIERSPDSKVADHIESHFDYCEIRQYYTLDQLNHTTLNLYY